MRVRGRDRRPRKHRSDSGKKRKTYAGKPCEYKHTSNFKEWYGKDEERTNRHKEITSRARKKYHSKNKDSISIQMKQLRKTNPIRFKIEDRKKYLRKISKPSKRIEIRLRTRVNIAIRNYSETGKIMTSRQYEIDYQKIIEHLKPFPEDLSKYHIDHIRPLCSFDLTDLEQVKIAFTPENHQWLTIKENLKKGGRW